MKIYSMDITYCVAILFSFFAGILAGNSRFPCFLFIYLFDSVVDKLFVKTSIGYFASYIPIILHLRPLLWRDREASDTYRI